MADADNYSSGGGDRNDWELVSLTASTYAAAPGPILPLLQVDKRESQSPPAAAIFMSQHFNLPAEARTHLNGCEEFTPAMVDDADLNMPCAKDCETELDDSLNFWDDHKNDVLFADGNGLQGGGLGLAGDEQTTMLCSPDAGSDIHTSVRHGSADAATDGIVDSPSLTAHVPVAISSGIACIAAKDQPKIPCEAEAWWKKTFSFLRNNSKESLTFRFIFVAATIVGLAILGQREKLQLQQLRLEFNVDSEISCAVGEPLGQVKGNMIVGGSPVAQG